MARQHLFYALLSLAILPFSWALKFDLAAHTGRERCIRNFVAKDTLVLVTAIVDGQKGDGQQVNMHIKDAVGNEYGRPKDIVGETRMAFTSHADAAFDVCFENQLVSSRGGSPSRHIELDVDIGADARDWSAIQAQEKLKPVETELRRIEELVGEIVGEMDYLRTREQKLRDTNESTNERVKWFAFGTMGMLVGLGAWQVVYLRAYFSAKIGRTVPSTVHPQARLETPEANPDDLRHQSEAITRLAPTTMPPKTDDSTPSKARSKPSITYELAVPDLKPLGSLLTIKMVDVFVGAKRKTFRLHEDLLCDRSDYFKATFQGEFAEAKSKELYLPDDNDAPFELFVNWLYGGDPRIKQPSNDEQLSAHFGLLALAEKILIEHLRNLVTDHIRGYYRDSKARVFARDLSFLSENTRGHLMQRSLTVVAAMQTLKSSSNKGLPADMRELITNGGEVAAAFAKYLLYSQEYGKISMIDHMLDPNRSCTFHYHDYTPKCKGPAVGKLDDFEEGSAQKAKAGK